MNLLTGINVKAEVSAPSRHIDSVSVLCMRHRCTPGPHTSYRGPLIDSDVPICGTRRPVTVLRKQKYKKMRVIDAS